MLCCQNCRYFYNGICNKHNMSLSLYERYTRICNYHTMNDNEVETIEDKLRKSNFRIVGW